MQRRTLLRSLTALTALPLASPALRAAGQMVGIVVPPLHKPVEAWRKLLPPLAFAVLFQEATERAFTSPLLNEHRQGTFVCAACYLPLFDARAKFESGTGWPSFTRCLPGHCGFKVDRKLAFEVRTEYHCIRCGGHQGHVFDDGPPPLHKRWCNNGVALAFIPKGQALPAWRT